jgi:hypothetical protein
MQIEAALILTGLPLALARLRNGRNQFGLATAVTRRLVQRLSLGIKRMIPGGLLVR